MSETIVEIIAELRVDRGGALQPYRRSLADRIEAAAVKMTDALIGTRKTLIGWVGGDCVPEEAALPILEAIKSAIGEEADGEGKTP